jgi:prolyl 4-hydroxylase
LSEITRLALNSSFDVPIFQINCAPVCESCEQLHIDARCPMDPTASNAWNPGDLNAMFERIVTDPAYAAYQPKVLSRPSYAPGDTNETADYTIGLWMVMFDSAVSDEEADRLRELGEIQGYERSSDVGEEQPDGTFTAYVNEKRTSTNSVRLRKAQNGDVSCEARSLT